MADRRTEILEAAIALIVDEGYSSLTMRALAREVGMKLASLQYHFMFQIQSFQRYKMANVLFVIDSTMLPSHIRDMEEALMSAK